MALILGGHLALFLLYPGAAGPFSKGYNIGAVLDQAMLGSSHPGLLCIAEHRAGDCFHAAWLYRRNIVFKL